MKQVPLSAKTRTARGSSRARRLRSSGFVPAEVYGRNETNQSIEVSEKELGRILSSSEGQNIFFELKIDGSEGKPILAVLKEVQYHRVNHSLIHADFHKVKMDQKIRIKIPIRVLNADICEGVKVGGVLQTLLRALEVQCLPTQIPDAIEVDATLLAVGHSVHVSDLKLPKGVKPLQSPEIVVVSVAAQMAEEVKPEVAPAVEGAAPEAGAEPEVITAKKPEEGEAEAKAPTAEKAAEKRPAEKKAPEKK